MKYESRKKSNKRIELEKETTSLVTEDFDESEYIDEEFIKKEEVTKKEKKTKVQKKKTEKIEKPKKEKKRLFSRNKEEDLIIYGDDEELEITKKVPTIDKIKEEKPVLKIEPIRTVTEEELYKMSKKKEQGKKKEIIDEDSIVFEEIERKPIAKKIINIIFVICLILIVTTTIDIIMVSRYEKGPYFAIKTKTYNDGGTKEYYGIGYKVIKYNQLQGRKDEVIGLWNLKYDVEPITVSDLDLSIEFNNDGIESYDRYYKKFVRIDSTLKKINKKDNSIIIGFEDEDGKYTMDIKCKMVKNNKNISDFKKEEKITVIGTVRGYKQQTSTNPNKLVLSDCFAEQ